MVQGYREWDHFRHKIAYNNLQSAKRKLAHYIMLVPGTEQLYRNIEENLHFLSQYQTPNKTEEIQFMVKDLFANALRRGDLEHKYD